MKKNVKVEMPSKDGIELALLQSIITQHYYYKS